MTRWWGIAPNMVQRIIGYLMKMKATGILYYCRKGLWNLLNSEPQFLAIGTIIKHPDYPK